MLPAGLEDSDDGLAIRAWELTARGASRWAGGLKALRASIGRFLQLLSSPSMIVRARAWALAPELLRMGVIEPDELARLKGSLAELLSSRKPGAEALADAWEAAVRLAEAGVLRPGDLLPASGSLWDLVARSSGSLRQRLEQAGRRLAEMGVIRGPGISRGWRVLGEDVTII